MAKPSIPKEKTATAVEVISTTVSEAAPGLKEKVKNAMEALAQMPPNMVKEAEVIARPVTTAYGKLLNSFAGMVEGAGDRFFSHKQQKELAALEERFANEERVLVADIAMQLVDFDNKQKKSCISFINSEILRIQEGIRGQLDFFWSCKKDMQKQISEMQKSKDSTESSSESELDKLLSESFREDFKIINELIKFEADLYKQLRVNIVDTLVNAHQLPRINVKALKELRDSRLIEG
jgi:hypothetical protein